MPSNNAQVGHHWLRWCGVWTQRILLGMSHGRLWNLSEWRAAWIFLGGNSSKVRAKDHELLTCRSQYESELNCLTWIKYEKLWKTMKHILKNHTFCWYRYYVPPIFEPLLSLLFFFKLNEHDEVVVEVVVVDAPPLPWKKSSRCENASFREGSFFGALFFWKESNLSKFVSPSLITYFHPYHLNSPPLYQILITYLSWERSHISPSTTSQHYLSRVDDVPKLPVKLFPP